MDSREAHLYFTSSEVNDFCFFKDYKNILAPEEYFQYQNYRHLCLRRNYFISRLLVRTVLSSHFDVSPSEWRFHKNKFGCPEVVYPKLSFNIRFSLSHTQGIIACLLGINKILGIDVEYKSYKPEIVNIANSFFSKSEKQDLEKLSFLNHREHFFKLWVLKESYIKAIGKGLSIPLDSFSFSIKSEQSIKIKFDSIKDNPDNWQFRIYYPTPQHVMSIAIRKNKEKDLYIKKSYWRF